MTNKNFSLLVICTLITVIIVKGEDSTTSVPVYGNQDRKLTNSIDTKDIHFYVYSNQAQPNGYHEVKVGDIESLERSKMVPGKVIILVDGWLDKDTHVKVLKNGYLGQGIRNVVILNYYDLNASDLPFPFFMGSYFGGLNNIPKVGKKGFSLGAHVCGSIGLMMKKKYKMKLGRITGLDPAGPFTKFLKANRLNKSQAVFVDVIHTDVGALGTSTSMGHADFFINGGLAKNIPGCSEKDPIFQHGCAHIASFVLYYKTITNENTFIGCSCGQLPAKHTTTCGNLSSCKTPSVVGENCSPGARGDFFVKTSVNISSGRS